MRLNAVYSWKKLSVWHISKQCWFNCANDVDKMDWIMIKIEMKRRVFPSFWNIGSNSDQTKGFPLERSLFGCISVSLSIPLETFHHILLSFTFSQKFFTFVLLSFKLPTLLSFLTFPFLNLLIPHPRIISQSLNLASPLLPPAGFGSSSSPAMP